MGKVKGYNLFEVTLWCLLTGTLSTIGFSMIEGIRDQQGLHLASESFLSAISAARFEAMSKNLAVQIRIHPSQDQFALALRNKEPDLWQSLPKGVSFSRVPSKPITFFSRGSAAPAGTFILKNRRGQIKVIVSISGRVRWIRES
ncbi:MAG: GspH/FimT family protein [Acidobacteriota bacterium]